MRYLVDTDILIDVAKKNQEAVHYLDSLEEGWSISVVTAMELVVGARDKKELGKIDHLLTTYQAIPRLPAVGILAYALLKEFAKSHGLRVLDALIAASAIESERTLLTRNEKHFRMIPALKLEVPTYSTRSS